MRTAALAALLAGALAFPSRAQEKPVMSRRPEAGQVRPYKAPPRHEYILPSGLKLVVIEDHRFPLVTARLAVRAGAASVPREDAGMAEAMAALLTEGTELRNAKMVADEADAIGGEIEVSAAQDYVVVGAYALSEFLPRLLKLVRDVALRPTFPTDEVELRAKNMLDELNVERSDPGFLAGVAFEKKLYGGHAYAVTAPTEASIERIDRDRLKELHARLFSPRGAVLVLAGDVAPSALRLAAEQDFAEWKASGPAVSPAEPVVLSTEPAAARRVYLVDRPGSSQTVLYLGNVALTEDSTDYFKLLLANQVLGGSFSSRLMLDLREKKGYTYGIGSRLRALVHGGEFLVRTEVRTEVTVKALEDILAHLDGIRGAPVSEPELRQAQSYLAGSFTRRLETQAGVADNVLHAILHKLPADYLDTYVQKVQAVTAEEAQAAAQAYIRPDATVVVAVGDAAKIRDALAKFSPSPVQLVDVNGD